MTTLRVPRHAPTLPFPRPDAEARRRRAEMEFLPAALEILERSPPPTAQALIGGIIAFALLAGGWAWPGHVDVVAVAQGRVIPSGHGKTVRPMEIGVGRATHEALTER